MRLFHKYLKVPRSHFKPTGGGPYYLSVFSVLSLAERKRKQKDNWQTRKKRSYRPYVPTDAGFLNQPSLIGPLICKTVADYFSKDQLIISAPK